MKQNLTWNLNLNLSHHMEDSLKTFALASGCWYFSSMLFSPFEMIVSFGQGESLLTLLRNIKAPIWRSWRLFHSTSLRITSHIISHIIHHTSYITQHTSHITHHTSHINLVPFHSEGACLVPWCCSIRTLGAWCGRSRPSASSTPLPTAPGSGLCSG